jgi:IS30 family transposase
MQKRRTWLTPNLRSALWSAWTKGMSLKAVAAMLDIRWSSVAAELQRCGGIAPRNRRHPRALTEHEREQISRCIARGWSVRAIAHKLGRAPSTVSREIRRNYGRTRYRACSAERRAWKAARRPKPGKLAHNRRLRGCVEDKLRLWWSPKQISAWLALTFGDDASMNVSHETIYRSLYIQARGALKAELKAHLRTGRMRRRPQRETKVGTASVVDGISISERPPEANDRAVPGHWEGDLLFGDVHSYIATLVERHTRYCILIKVPSKDTREVTEAIRKQIVRLPAHLRRSLTWDRGSEMSGHKEFTVATRIPVFFADPRSPWQRGSNENTNGLLRQWFPKGTDVSHYSQAELDKYAHLLNGRPRETLGYKTPAEVFRSLLR